MTTISVVVSGNGVVRVIRIIISSVNTNLNPSKQPIIQVITEVDILREGIISTISLLNTPHILGVGGDALRVGAVGVSILDGGAEDLVPEELADVGDAAGADFESFVWEEGCIQMGEEVGVGCSAFVVAWEDAFEGGYAVAVCLLDAA